MSRDLRHAALGTFVISREITTAASRH